MNQNPTTAEIEAENARKSLEAFEALTPAEQEQLRREVYAEMTGLPFPE